MATITITNISLSRLSLDIPVPSGGIGEGHPKAIRASLDTGESIDVGNIITVDDLNRTAEFQALMAANLISVVATAEVNDVAIPAVVSGTGWTDAATLITLTTLTDTVAIGAAAMSGLGEKLRVVHSTALVASLETTLAGAAGVRLALRHTKAGIGAVADIPGEVEFWGNNTTPTAVKYGSIQAMIIDPTAGAELGLLILNVWNLTASLAALTIGTTGTSMGGIMAATQGPVVSTVFVKGANGANNDIAGDWSAFAPSDNSTLREFSRIRTVATVAADGAEYGQVRLSVIANGAHPGTPQVLVSDSGFAITGYLGATTGPEMSVTFRKGAAGANGDVAGYLGFYANTSTSALAEWAYLSAIVVDANNASKDGALALNLLVGNADTEVARFTGAGLVLPGSIAVNGIAAPPAQHAKINDPAGGGTIDAESRTAIGAIIDTLEAVGFSAAV